MRVAVATVGTTGDVVPFVALAAALRRAGHAVTAVSWELHRDPFERAGAAFAAAGPATSWAQIADTARLAADARNPLQQVAVLRDFHLRDAAAHYRSLRQLLPGHDLVLLHGIHSLAEAAVRDADLRWASAVFDPVLLPTRTRAPTGMPSLGLLNPIGWWILDRILHRVGRPLGAALRQAGSVNAGSVQLFRGRSPLLHLVACSPALAGVPDDVPSHVHFTGPWAAATSPAPLPPQVESFLEAGPPPAVVTFGSMAFSDPARLGSVIAAGLRSAGLRGIVQAGAAGISPEPGADLLSIGELDHRSLFPHAAVVVHHGGAGTSHAVAAAGVPSVVIPHVGDQAYWAARLRRLGAAPPPLSPGTLDADTLADRLRTAATSARIHSAAVDLQRRLAGEDGLADAVGLIEAAASPAA